MLVDIVYPSWKPISGLGETKNTPSCIHSHSRILEYDFNHYIGGHRGIREQERCVDPATIHLGSYGELRIRHQPFRY